MVIGRWPLMLCGRHFLHVHSNILNVDSWMCLREKPLLDGLYETASSGSFRHIVTDLSNDSTRWAKKSIQGPCFQWFTPRLLNPTQVEIGFNDLLEFFIRKASRNYCVAKSVQVSHSTEPPASRLDWLSDPDQMRECGVTAHDTASRDN